jgi:serpin B
LAIKKFNSEAESIDFSQSVESARKINEWIEEKTNNKIKNVIDSDSLDSLTQMILINAIHFKATWYKRFERTYTEKFYLNEKETVETEFMDSIDPITCGHDFFPELNSDVLVLSYRETRVKMMIILPKSRTGLAGLEEKINEVNLDEISDSLNEENFRVIMPKFKIESEFTLKDVLPKVGSNFKMSVFLI